MKDWLKHEYDVWENAGKEKLRRYTEGISDEEIIQELRGEDIETLKLISNNAEEAPDNISLEDARCSMGRIGSQYYGAWIYYYQKKLDPYARFWATIDAYEAAPYKSIPKKMIINLKGIRPSDYLKDLDQDLLNTDPITIYRGGNETRKEANNSFSWSTDPITAIWFYARKNETYKDTGKGIKPQLWKGQIFKKDIIATDNNRGEHEIIQHGNIHVLNAIALSDTEIQLALNAENKRREEAYNDGKEEKDR